MLRDTGLWGKTAELNQPAYFKTVLTSEGKTGNVLHWRRGYTYISTGKEKLWVPSKLIKTRYERGDLLKILAADKEKIKRFKTSNAYADPFTQSKSETA